MKDLLIDKINEQKIIKVGDIVEGAVVGHGRSSVYVDLGIYGTGIIYGKEYQVAKDLLRKSALGEKIFAKITSLENEDGYIELSASKAGLDFAWTTIKEKKESGEPINAKIIGANKGGLLTKVMGLSAFIPVSQLSSQNYPKIDGGDSSKILKEIQRFIGTEMEVKILDFSQKDEKLILSEKIDEMERNKKLLEGYSIGDVVTGKITGIADFGAFISFGDNVEGLIHISELSWQVVNDANEVLKEGDDVEAKIVEINNDRVFLSIKALRENPWEKIQSKYSVGDTIDGNVVKINDFGAFIELKSKEDKVQGLCHVSEFGTVEKMSEELELNKKYKFEITSLEPQEHRIILKKAA